MGVGAKMFTVAGPVLVYGISASVIVGIIATLFSNMLIASSILFIIVFSMFDVSAKAIRGAKGNSSPSVERFHRMTALPRYA